MFEARFQTFDDSQRARRGAGARRRVARRAEAARARRIRGAARRPPAERISARRAKSGWPGSPASPARPARPSCSPSALRCSSTAATPCRRRRRPTQAIFADRASGRLHRRSNGSSRISRAAPSSATIRGCTPPRAPRSCSKACATAGAELVAVDDNPIDALWSDRPAPPAGPVSAARHQVRRRERRRQAQAHPRRAWQSCAPMCWWCPTRRTSPGPSISAARTSRIRRWRSPSRLIPREGRPALYVDAGQARQQSAPRAGGDSPRCARRTTLPATSRKLKGKTVRLDQASAADALTRLVAGSGGKPVRGADPIALMKAVKNHAEIAGSARRAQARRRGDGAVPRLARARGADRQADRDRRGRGAGKLPPRYRRC